MNLVNSSKEVTITKSPAYQINEYLVDNKIRYRLERKDSIYYLWKIPSNTDKDMVGILHLDGLSWRFVLRNQNIALNFKEILEILQLNINIYLDI